MTAQIFNFPDRRTCYRCVHSDDGFGLTHVRCQLFDMLIADPARTAQQCSSFEALSPPEGRGHGADQ